jgi:hypothetical protein
MKKLIVGYRSLISGHLKRTLPIACTHPNDQ